MKIFFARNQEKKSAAKCSAFKINRIEEKSVEKGEKNA
jgi:hypothetical protein